MAVRDYDHYFESRGLDHSLGFCNNNLDCLVGQTPLFEFFRLFFTRWLIMFWFVRFKISFKENDDSYWDSTATVLTNISLLFYFLRFSVAVFLCRHARLLLVNNTSSFIIVYHPLSMLPTGWTFSPNQAPPTRSLQCPRFFSPTDC